MALVFQAEAPPIAIASTPKDSRVESASEPRQKVSSEPDDEQAGAFVPTVPPKRMLTYADGLTPKENRARSSRIGRWLMAGLLVVLLSLVALWWRSHSNTPTQSNVASNQPGLEQYLHAANEALHAGDLVRAHDQLQASQTAGGRDSRWLILTARYDVMRADMNWLAVKLADPKDTAHLETLNHELSENVEQASRALNSVDQLAVDDPELSAARIDAQRLRGELAEAVKTAAALPKTKPSPEMAYSLATLELLSDHPNYKDVFDWLGIARAADAGLGRAPAMLVVACVTGQRLDNAKAELARLKSAQRSHPLLADIEAYFARAAHDEATDETAASSAPESSAEAPAAPEDSSQPAAAGSAEPASASSSETMADIIKEGDPRLRLRRGVESLGRGELTRAEMYFRSVLASRPTDTEALTGMGDVARKRGNTSSAISYYQKVLSNNGQYLPALSSLADVKWKSGDHAGAATLYRRIVDQVGESAGYGQVAARRLRELNEASPPKPNSAGDGDKAAAPAASAKPVLTDRAGKQP